MPMKNPFFRHYSLHKSKQILFQVYRHFQRQKKHLPEETVSYVTERLHSLEKAITEKNKPEASTIAKELEGFGKVHLKKGSWLKTVEGIFALAIALGLAVLIRMMWFELYEIPTGSMRPTFKEKDRLVVSKAPFGINVPMTTKHFYFNPELVKRGGTVVFTGEDMDMPDVDTRYFLILPGKKQFVKRMIGKPGDSLYFYGGKIYGVDHDGNDISDQIQLPELKKIDHVPFIYMSGKVLTPREQNHGVFSQAVLKQMNQPVARLYFDDQQRLSGEMLPLKETHYPGTPMVKEYGNLWGMKNYATARLLNKAELNEFTPYSTAEFAEGKLYLELKHNPSLKSLELLHDEQGRMRPGLKPSTSIIPLQEEDLKTLFNNLYTARFIVRDNMAVRYGNDLNNPYVQRFAPHLDVPDGMYEFYYGKGYLVKWQGITEELPPSHPLMQFNIERLQMLFNLGIEFDMRFAPDSPYTTLSPSRYAFFRNKALYVMGGKLLNCDDETLREFLFREQKRAEIATSRQPYLPFIDHGAPLNDEGIIDINFVRRYGITVPEESYLVLGDNYAMSGDTREFGFVPQGNLRGAPDWIFWPPGSRFGFVNQPAYPFFNLPRTIVWILVAIGIAIAIVITRKRHKLPLKFD